MTVAALWFNAQHEARRHGAWPIWAMVGLLACVVVMTGLIAGRLLHDDMHRMARKMGDPLWVPYQLGLQFNLLQLAVEEGAAVSELEVRVEVFLSYANRIRETPQFARVIGAMSLGHLATLVETARGVEDLLPELDTDRGRAELRQFLRDRATFIRDFVMNVSKLNREQVELEHAEKIGRLWLYVATMGILLLALLMLGGMAVRFLRKLAMSNMERERQYAIQTSILASVDEAIIGTETGGRISYFNAQALNMFGAGLEVGQKIAASGTVEVPLLGHLGELIDTFRMRHAPSLSVTRTVAAGQPGQIRHFVMRITAAGQRDEKDHDGEAHVITVRDVTFEVEAAQKREEYDSHIAEASRVLSYAVVTGGIVHEISQPLASLRNYVHVLKKSPESCAFSAEYRSVLSDLGLEVDRAMDVVRNVRAMGPSEDDELGRCNLGEAVAYSIRLVSLGSHPAPAIKITGSDMRLSDVKGSLPLMGQVIVNLLKNALQSSESAGRNGAEIHLRKHSGCAEITVIDHGAGVSAEVSRRMFLPFVRSSKGGMGLGLAICQRIAANIGGSLTWRNREEGGAAFCFTVPLAEKEFH